MFAGEVRGVDSAEEQLPTVLTVGIAVQPETEHGLGPEGLGNPVVEGRQGPTNADHRERHALCHDTQVQGGAHIVCV